MNLIQNFARVVSLRPKKVALITERNEMSFEDLLRLTHLVDIRLRTLGILPGQVLAVSTRRVEFSIALALIGSLRSLTIAYVDPKVAIESNFTFDRLVTTELTDLVTPDRQIVIEASWFEKLSSTSIPDWTNVSGGGMFITQSSGSTGRPKLIQSSEQSRLKQSVAALFFDRDTTGQRRFLTTLGPGTGYALWTNLTMLLSGGSVVSLTQDQDKLLQYLDLYRVDTLAISPAMVERILEIPAPEQYLASISDVRFLGAMTSPEILAAFSRICTARLNIGYGSGELGRVFAGVYDAKSPQQMGHVGQLVRDDLEVIFCDESLQPIPGAVEGIVGFRPCGGAFTRDYLGEDKSSVDTGFKNGIFFPGDVMRRVGREYFVVGRTKNIINFGGNNVALESVTGALAAAFPGASFVPTVDLDPLGLERLSVVYRAVMDISPRAMESALRAHFVGLTVRRVRRVTAFPLTDSGKVDVQALKVAWD